MSRLTLQDGAMPPGGMRAAAKAKWHPLLHRREVLNTPAQEHPSLLTLPSADSATWHDVTRQNPAHCRLAGVGKSVFPSSWSGVSDGAVIQIAQLATRLGFSADTPGTSRMLSFSDFARTAGTDVAGDQADSYEIVVADGTVEVLDE